MMSDIPGVQPGLDLRILFKSYLHILYERECDSHFLKYLSDVSEVLRVGSISLTVAKT